MKFLNVLILSLILATTGCKTTSPTASSETATTAKQEPVQMTLASVAGTNEEVKVSFYLEPDEIERNVPVSFEGEEDWRFVNKTISVPHSIALQTKSNATKVVISNNGSVTVVPIP